MKTRFYWILLFVFATADLSCDKEKDPFTDLTADNLTECASCDFLYQESTRLDGLPGNAIVFRYRAYWASADGTSVGPNYSGLSFEIPSDKTSFSYDKSVITTEKVEHVTMCINCGTVNLEPVDGFIKGKKEKNNKWLVEAEVALAAPSGEIIDTVAFKQYFTPDK
ncbi:hypothetical protein [Parapedobacter tibetensis]|uniref:hypothetical protein n=1 Tax=Parapedobacter tibetensis TaxID=2972951 RepID=UPI00214DCF44|nr:hypothetical protein [Parapedobacter tibetensis]